MSGEDTWVVRHGLQKVEVFGAVKVPEMACKGNSRPEHSVGEGTLVHWMELGGSMIDTMPSNVFTSPGSFQCMQIPPISVLCASTRATLKCRWDVCTTHGCPRVKDVVLSQPRSSTRESDWIHMRSSEVAASTPVLHKEMLEQGSHNLFGRWTEGRQSVSTLAPSIFSR